MFVLGKSFRGDRANAVLILTSLAVGMAAVTLVYAVLDAVLLRPLPYANGDQLSVLWTLEAKKTPILSAPARLRDLARDAQRWESISGFYGENLNLVAVNGQNLEAPERVAAIRTIPNFTSAIGMRLAMGRAPEGREEEFGGAKTLIVSDSFWRSHMGAAPNAVGQTLTLNGDRYTVVGVAQRDFRFPSANTALFVPAQFHPNLQQARGARFLVGLGMRKPGVSPQEGSAELQALVRTYGKQFGAAEADYGVGLEDPRAYLVGRDTRRSIVLLSAAVVLLLGIATVNAANLMLARGLRRMRDYALQMAVGAPSRVILREILFEGVVLSTAGGILGAFLSWWSLELVLHYWKTLPTFRDPVLDWRVMAISLGIAACTGILCSLAPAWQASRLDALATLRNAHRSVSGREGAWWRRLLVAGEVALCFLLLAGAWGLSQSLRQLDAVPLGLQATNLLTFSVSLPWEMPTEKRMAFFRQLRESFAESGLVERVALADRRPLDAPVIYQLRADNRVTASIAGTNVSPGYFETLGIPLLRGRAFEPTDLPGKERVVVLSESAAKMFFGSEDPLGKRLYQDWNGQAQARTVVGIVGDTPIDLRKGPQAMKYEASQDDQWPSPVFFVQGRGETAAVLADLKRRMREKDPARAMYGVTLLQSYIDNQKSEPRVSFVLVSLFGGTAAILAFLGLFGVLSWYVAQRTSEIGVRMALGARPAQVVALIVQQGLAPSLWGSLVGLACVAWGMPYARLVLFQTDMRWACLWAGAGILLLAACAMVLPAWRASRLNPLEALRRD